MTKREFVIFEKLKSESFDIKKIKNEDVNLLQVSRYENCILIWYKNKETKWKLNVYRFMIIDQDVEDYINNIIVEFRESIIDEFISEIHK